MLTFRSHSIENFTFQGSACNDEVCLHTKEIKDNKKEDKLGSGENNSLAEHLGVLCLLYCNVFSIDWPLGICTIVSIFIFGH